MSIRHASLMAEAAGIVEQNTPFAHRPSKLAAELRAARDEIMEASPPATGSGVKPPPAKAAPAAPEIWDRYAMAALSGYLAANPEVKVGAQNAAREAGFYADAMIAERAKRGIGS